MSSRERLFVLAAALALSGCNCFVPVEECVGKKCLPRPDGGAADAGRDGGSTDGGATTDAGTSAITCAVWDGGGVGKCSAVTGYVALGTECRGECVQYPIVTPGVFPSLAACTACGCNPAKLTAKPVQVFNATSFCDEVNVTTSLPAALDDVFDVPGDAGRDFDGGCVATGAVDYRCRLIGSGTLGDAGVARACAATLTPGVADVNCLVLIQ